MNAENYLTVKNIRQKTREWLNAVKEYSKEIKATDLKNSALLVIDMQNFFLEKNSIAYVPAGRAILPNIKKLISAFKTGNRPIIFTRFALDKGEENAISKWWGYAIREETHEAEIIPELAPDTHSIIVKKAYNAFYGTDLGRQLAEKNIKTIVIAGILTNLCCDATARDAFMCGYNVYFAVDATAADNEDLHLSSIKALSQGFVIPTSAANLAKRLLAR